MRPLTEIFDVGDTRAAHLQALGVESVADVASADLGTLTTLEGVGRARAEKIRYSARQLAGDRGSEARDGRPSGGDNRPAAAVERPARGDASTERRERVTARDVTAGDVVVLVPGGLLVTDVGGTDHRALLDAGVVSVPGDSFVAGSELAPLAGGDRADLALDAAVVCFPAPRLADEAPDLYGALAGLDGRDGSTGFPGEGFLGPSVTAVEGRTLLGLRDASPELESDIVALLTRGTVFLDGRSFDVGNPHDVSVLQSGGVYVPGSAVLPEGTVFACGAVVRGEATIPDASLFDTGVVPVDGTAAVGDLDPDTPQTLSVLRQGGVLLPPGSTRTEG